MEVDSGSERGSVLEAALIDQRMRADKHKLNFDALKVQHVALQERYQTVRLDCDTLTDNYDRLHRKSQDIIQKLQSERDDKIVECETLRKHSLTGLRLEQLKLQLADEIEEPFRKRTITAEAELESLRSEHNKLKYNYSLLKSQYDDALLSHKSMLDEVTAKFNIELSAMEEEKKNLLARAERDVPMDMQRIRQLDRENGELQQRVKTLMAENESVQAEKELVEEHNHQDHQVQSRQLVELQALNKTLELERTSLSSQVQSLQAELSKSYQQHQSFSEQLIHTQRQLTDSGRKLEETEYKHTMRASEVDMKHVEQCRELQQERDLYVSDHMMSQAQVEALTKTLKEQDMLLADKEQHAEQRVQAAREKEWEKQVELEREKVELEEKVAELERLRSSTLEECQLKIDKLEAAVNEVQTEKSQVESQLELVNGKLQDKSDQTQTLLKEVQELSQISKKYHTLHAEHISVQQSEMKLREVGRGLEEAVNHLEEELFKSRQEMVHAQEEMKKNMESEMQSWLEERKVLTDRVEECQARQVAVSQKLTESRKEAKKLQRHYKKQLQEMKQTSALRIAEMDKQNMEKTANITALNLENQRLKGQFSEVQRKRKEFMFLLQNNPLIAEVQQSRHCEGVRFERSCDDWEHDLEARHDLEVVQQQQSRGSHQHGQLPTSESILSAGDP